MKKRSLEIARPEAGFASSATSKRSNGLWRGAQKIAPSSGLQCQQCERSGGEIHRDHDSKYRAPIAALLIQQRCERTAENRPDTLGHIQKSIIRCGVTRTEGVSKGRGKQ